MKDYYPPKERIDDRIDYISINVTDIVWRDDVTERYIGVSFHAKDKEHTGKRKKHVRQYRASRSSLIRAQQLQRIQMGAEAEEDNRAMAALFPVKSYTKKQIQEASDKADMYGINGIFDYLP